MDLGHIKLKVIAEGINNQEKVRIAAQAQQKGLMLQYKSKGENRINKV